MSQLLVLSEDELALLRFTGDLFFVDESPLIHVERAAREPADYAGSYKALVDRNIVDPHGFRITDDALNQLAPVTECDARIVHIIVDDDGTITQQDHWLLDEIAVVYERHGEGAGAKHLFGPDLDPHQLVQRLGRQLVPRRSGGERFDATLSAHDVVATTLLVEASNRFDRRVLSLDEVRTSLGKMPADDGLVAALPALSSGRLGITKKPAREVRSIDAIVRSLTERGVVVAEGSGLRLHTALFALRGRRAARHTLVRTDFRDDDWLVREVTLLPVEGSLFLIAPARGGFRIAELDGDALYAVLREACGPASTSSPERPAPEPQRLAALLAGQPRRG